MNITVVTKQEQLWEYTGVGEYYVFQAYPIFMMLLVILSKNKNSNRNFFIISWYFRYMRQWWSLWNTIDIIWNKIPDIRQKKFVFDDNYVFQW